MPRQHAVLVVQRRALEAARLPDGGLTLDIEEARRQDRADARRRAAQPRVEGQPLDLRIPPAAARTGRRTPGRVAKLLRLVEMGFVSPADAQRLAPAGEVGDAAWKVILEAEQRTGEIGGDVEPVPELEVESVDRWAMRLQTATEDRDVCPDPLAYPTTSLPLQAIVGVLDELAGEGWRVVHVSEDRGVDAAGERTIVTSLRYLLVND